LKGSGEGGIRTLGTV